VWSTLEGCLEWKLGDGEDPLPLGEGDPRRDPFVLFAGSGDLVL